MADPAAAPSTAGAGGVPRVAVEPTHIVSSRQTLSGLSYKGISTLDTPQGSVRALKFTASSVVIDGLNQDVQYTQGRLTLRASTVTLEGNVSLYILSQKGSVFGLLPLTLSPSSPPPLIVPSLFFTNVDSQIAYIQADTLRAPGAQITVS